MSVGDFVKHPCGATGRIVKIYKPTGENQFYSRLDTGFYGPLNEFTKVKGLSHMSEKCILREELRERINNFIDTHEIYETDNDCESLIYVLVPWNKEIEQIMIDSGMSREEMMDYVDDDLEYVDILPIDFEWAFFSGSKFHGPMTYQEWVPLLEKFNKVKVMDDDGGRAIHHEGRQDEKLDYETANSYFMRCTIMSPAN